MPKVEESMRELIFRGKRIDDGEWVEGYYSDLPKKNIFATFGQGDEDYIPADDISCCIIQTKTKQHPYFSNANPCQVFECDIFEVIPETVGQFTGLLDKNKKKIFEGDILRVADRRIWYSYKLFMLSESEKINMLKELPCVDRVVEIPRIYDWRFEKDKEYWEIIGSVHDKEEL